MEEKFIEIESSKEDKDKNKKNEIKKEENFLPIIPIPFNTPRKRKAQDIKGRYQHLTSPKRRNIIDYESKHFKFDFNLMHKEEDAYLYEIFKIVNMTPKEKILKECHDFLKRNRDFKEGDATIIKYLNQFISLKLIEHNLAFVVEIDNKIFTLFELAREITFVNFKLETITKKFIYSPRNLKDTLNKLEFKSYYIKNYDENADNDDKDFIDLKLEKGNNSESSEVSLDENIIFNDEKVILIYSESQKPILNNKNYDNRFNEEINKLKDLSYNSKYYYKNSDRKFHKLNNNYKLTTSNFVYFEESNKSKIVYLYGPKRCSKTTFLLTLINTYRYYDTRTLYFDLNYLENKNYYDKKRIIYHELLYFCKDINEMKAIEKKKIFSIILDKNNIMELIYFILISLLDIIDVNNNIRRIIIIDNIYNNNDDVRFYLGEIIKLIYNKNYKIKLIICGRGPYFNQKFFDFYERFDVITDEDKFIEKESFEFMYLFCAKNSDINKLLSQDEIKQNETEDESNLIKELELKKYSFYQIYFSEELDKYIISHNILKTEKNYLMQFPLEYFEIKKSNDDLTFKFYDKSFKKCFRNIMGIEIEKGALTNLIRRNDYPRTFFGICFEKLITLLLMYNKLNLRNLNFKKGNIKEISEIAKLKEDYYSGPVFEDIDKDNPILVVQENFFGPLYDLLIITKRNDFYYSDFIQIGADKSKDQIYDIIKDLKSRNMIYKSNILKAFGINSDFISVLFIFDYDTQKKNNFSKGFDTCTKDGINFYLFSLADCSLVELGENKVNKKLVDEYFPSFIINENKNKNSNLGKKKKKSDKEDNDITTKITNYFKTIHI